MWGLMAPAIGQPGKEEEKEERKERQKGGRERRCRERRRKKTKHKGPFLPVFGREEEVNSGQLQKEVEGAYRG